MDKSATHILLLLLIVLSSTARAQEVVRRDSLSRFQPENASRPIVSSPTGNENLQPITTDSGVPEIDNKQHDIDPHAIDTSVNIPTLPSWKGGMMTGSNSFYSNGFGMGYDANVMAVQNLGRFTLSGNAGLSKDFMSGIGIRNGVNAGLNLSYAISDNVSVTGFGGMLHTGFMGPLPNMTNFYYGGYFSLMTNNKKWGMDVGMRRYYDAATGRWTTVPVAMPYYNWNGSKIGFDFGGLLLDAFHGLDKALNGDRTYIQNGKLPGGGIIMPDIDTAPHFGSPDIPYIK